MIGDLSYSNANKSTNTVNTLFCFLCFFLHAALLLFFSSFFFFFLLLCSLKILSPKLTQRQNNNSN